jgi:hypothetical protein
MIEFLIKLLLVARTRLKSRARLEAENLVLRQQVIVLSRKARTRVRLRIIDRLIFVWLYHLIQAAIRLGNSSPHPKATGQRQRDEQSDCRVDRWSGDRRVSLGRIAEPPDSRPRRRIRYLSVLKILSAPEFERLRESQSN